MKKYTVVFLTLFSLLAFNAYWNWKAPSDKGFTAGPQHVRQPSVFVHGTYDVERTAMQQIGAKFNRDMEVQLAIYTLSQH